jgi:hypothetical protein
MSKPRLLIQSKRRLLYILCFIAAISCTTCTVSALPIPEKKQTMHIDLHLFRNKSQVDVVTVLMLLGEATIWKAIWGRLRSCRSHWKHWIFAISPGWTPLAASLFAAMYGSLGPVNFVYDRPPEACIDNCLILTNLNSGASHSATNTILQNIWHTWNKGARNQQNPRKKDYLFDLTREIGLADVSLDLLHLENPRTFWLQVLCLAAQIIGSFTLGFFGWSFETLFAMLAALLSQALLVLAIIPREKAWFKTTRGHRPCPVMFHRGLDSTAVLIIRTATVKGREVSLEEYCWDNQASRDYIDELKPLAAGFSFLVWILHIVLVGWMRSESSYLYLLFGGLGLCTTAIEAATEPRWSGAFRSAFTKHTLCAPLHSSLMSAVAILTAGRFPSAQEAAKLLYPDNSRFQKSLQELDSHFNQILCTNCRDAIKCSKTNQVQRCLRIEDRNGRYQCQSLLASRIRTVHSKQIADGLAAVHNYLQISNSKQTGIPTIETHERFQHEPRHPWESRI